MAILVACAIAGSGADQGVAQETLYFDDFSGAGAALNGATPDTSLGGGSWAAGANLADNGVASATAPANGQVTALLPFQPQANFIYTLSADIFSSTDAGTGWTALGFTQGLGTNLNARWISGGQVPVLWALSTANTSGAPDSSFIGPGTGGSQPAATSSSDRLVMTLDTTGVQWEWSVDYGGDGVDRTEQLASIPNINFVGLSISNLPAGSSFDNFLLTRLAAPLNEWDVDGGGGFNTAGNWSQNVVPGAVAVFGSAHTVADSTAVVALNAPVSLGDIRFANDNPYALAGPSSLTLTGDASVATILGDHEISALIAGSAGLAKSGGGTLTLSNGSNSYTGDTTVSAGALRVTNLGAISQASGVVNLAAGATLSLDGNGAGNGASGVLSEQISGAGSLVLGPGLTTEVITATTANPSFSGAVSINGGTLRVSNAAALGAADGTAANGATVGGLFVEGKLELNGVTVVGERLQIDGRQPGVTAPHLSSTGASGWTGPIAGAAGGLNYNIESQSGELTLSGSITMPDGAAVRILNLSGAGNGRITGNILEGATSNIAVVKSGTGTWTIDTNSLDPADYHQAGTVIQQGTLAVIGKTINETGANDDGELVSSTIEVAANAVFDVSTFSTYSLQLLADPDNSVADTGRSSGDERGQTLSGSGQILGNLAAFDDSTIAPGDSRGTLTVTGNFSYSTFGQSIAGGWDFELGDSTAANDSDRLVVNGSTTIAAGEAADVIKVNITPADGTLAAGGSYTLLQATSGLSFSGSASNATYVEAVVDSQGNDITDSMRQTVAVSHSGNNVVLTVTGASANLNWAGVAGSTWDVQTTKNWTGGDTQFRQLDHVTFGNVANKNVEVDTNVAPGSVTFNGGAGSTYTLTGSGGLTGAGPVNIASAAVLLRNTGNAYTGTTTVASGATLGMDSASTGSMVVNGTLTIGEDAVSSGGGPQTFFTETFSGLATDDLGGTATDVGGATWTASPNFNADGSVDNGAGSATVPFIPAQGGVYTFAGTVESTNADQWIAIGFADDVEGFTGQTGTNWRFSNAGLPGYGWAITAPSSGQSYFAGPRAGTTILAEGAPDLATGNPIDFEIVLDTTGEDWTITLSRDGVVAATHTYAGSAPIDSLGFSSTGTAVGRLSDFSLTGVEPLDSRVNGQTLTVNGDLTMASASTLKLDLALIGQDFVDVTGAATLDGTIHVTKLGAFTPDGGAQYTLLSAADGITDLGATYVLPAGFSASIVDMTDLVLTFGSLALPGDFNGDSSVDAADYTLWRDNLGAADESSLNNNGDGMNGIDAADYLVWRSNFGASAVSAAVLVQEGAAVPEPASVALAMMALTGLASRRARRVKTAARHTVA